MMFSMFKCNITFIDIFTFFRINLFQSFSGPEKFAICVGNQGIFLRNKFLDLSKIAPVDNKNVASGTFGNMNFERILCQKTILRTSRPIF